MQETPRDHTKTSTLCYVSFIYQYSITRDIELRYSNCLNSYHLP